MVNTGRPSGGCDICKKRKIKCDETRPFCRRCQKAGRDCPGVPEAAELAFRVLRWGSRQPSSSTGTGRQIAGPGQHDSDSQQYATDSSSDGEATTSIQGELRYPEEHQALALFFHDYTGRLGDPRLRQRPYFLLHQMYASAAASEPIFDALCACALHILARFKGAQHLHQMGNKKYFDGLTSLRKSLSSPEHALSDGVLGGIMMIKIFEVRITMTIRASRAADGDARQCHSAVFTR